MRIGSLFSGIGGLELGLEWSGLGHTVWQVERDEYCRRVLARHWPDAERFDDVCAVGASTLAPVDVICGGFPCQDVSSAGKGAGLAGNRSGLWFEFRRIVEEMRPEWVVIENVASGGNRWVDAVTGHLEELGYGSIPFPLSAFDVGAPHLRRRIFIVAHATEQRLEGTMRERVQRKREASMPPVNDSRCAKASPDTIGKQLREQQGGSGWSSWRGKTESPHDGGTRIASDRDRDREPTLAGDDSQVARLREHRSNASPWPAPPTFRSVDDGIPRRVDQLRALGNAVVPQCAEVIGHIIQELEEGALI